MSNRDQKVDEIITLALDTIALNTRYGDEAADKDAEIKHLRRALQTANRGLRGIRIVMTSVD